MKLRKTQLWECSGLAFENLRFILLVLYKIMISIHTYPYDKLDTLIYTASAMFEPSTPGPPSLRPCSTPSPLTHSSPAPISPTPSPQHLHPLHTHNQIPSSRLRINHTLPSSIQIHPLTGVPLLHPLLPRRKVAWEIAKLTF